MFRNAIVSLVLLAPACVALANTDCSSIVAAFTIQTGAAQAGFMVELKSGVSFAMTPRSAGYREVLNVVQVATVTGAQVTARFAANGVRCDAKQKRDDLVAFVVRSEMDVSTPTTGDLPRYLPREATAPTTIPMDRRPPIK